MIAPAYIVAFPDGTFSRCWPSTREMSIIEFVEIITDSVKATPLWLMPIPQIREAGGH